MLPSHTPQMCKKNRLYLQLPLIRLLKRWSFYLTFTTGNLVSGYLKSNVAVDCNTYSNVRTTASSQHDIFYVILDLVMSRAIGQFGVPRWARGPPVFLSWLGSGWKADPQTV